MKIHIGEATRPRYVRSRAQRLRAERAAKDEQFAALLASGSVEELPVEYPPPPPPAAAAE